MPNGQPISGYFALVPLTGEQMLGLPRSEITARIVQAINVLAGKGCSIVGLGAFTGSALTAGGRRLQGKVNCGLTTGNAYTAVVTLQTIADVAAEIGYVQEEQHYAIVGATGSVGSAVAVSLAGTIGTQGSLTLIARNSGRLDTFVKECREVSPHPKSVMGSTNVEAVVQANVVIVTTSANGYILTNDSVASGTIIIDDTQPRNTHPELLCRKDVLIVDGGFVSTPDINYGMEIGCPPGEVFACWAETMMLAAEGNCQDFHLGNVTMPAVHYVTALAGKYGLRPAPYRSFGNSISSDAFKMFGRTVFGGGPDSRLPGQPRTGR